MHKLFKQQIMRIFGIRMEFGKQLVGVIIASLLCGCSYMGDNGKRPDALGLYSSTVEIVAPGKAHNLPWIVQQAGPGTTILLEDGVYEFDGSLRFEAPRVTLRSKSGNRTAVVLDGAYHAYMIHVSAPDITIADLTLKRARHHLVHVVGNGHRVKLRNLKLVDARQQFIKANPSNGRFCDFGEVSQCYFELTDVGRQKVDPIFGGCYTGGIDVLSGQGWRVYDNRFENIYCTNGGLPTHMVLFWQTSRDTIVERNTIINCARGIGFGLGREKRSRSYSDNPTGNVSGYIGHIGGFIQDNIIISNIGKYYDTGIGLEQAWKAKVEDNIVYSTGETFSSIDSRYPNSNPFIKNNLVRPEMTVRDRAQPVFENNMVLP
jgi:hypothetical protein